MKVKVICLNMWIGGKLMKNIIEFLKKEDAAIIALQEVHNGTDTKMDEKYRSIEILKKNLPMMKHVSFSPTFKDNVKGFSVERGNAILSRYPIASSNTVFFDQPYKEFDDIEGNPVDHTYDPRNLQHAEIKIDNKTLNVFNTQGIWGLDGVDNERRLHMSRVIVEQIRDKENVILTGDFNVRPNTQTIENIEKHLVNMFKDELSTSFNMKQKTNPGYADAVVDMMFVSKNIQVIDHHCPQVDVSDHFPLVATLEV